jgi:hypothetical protein
MTNLQSRTKNRTTAQVAELCLQSAEDYHQHYLHGPEQLLPRLQHRRCLENARQHQTDVLWSASHTGITVEEMEERINASERTKWLTGFGLSAASRTAWEDKVRPLGRSMASGLLIDDDRAMRDWMSGRLTCGFTEARGSEK